MFELLRRASQLSGSVRRTALVAIVTIAFVGVATASYASARGNGDTVSLSTEKATPSTAAGVAAQQPSITAAPVTEAQQTTTTAAVSARPKMLAAASTLDRIVLIDPQSGKTTKVLVSYPAIDNNKYTCGHLVGNVSLSPDNKFVYYDITTGTDPQWCGYEIRRVSTGGGESTRVTEGSEPTVAADGKSLAFVRDITKTENVEGIGKSIVSQRYQVIMRDLQSGDENIVVDKESCGCDPSISVSYDAKKIAVQDVSCGCGGISWESLSIYDVKTHKATEVDLPQDNDSTKKNQRYAWGDASFLPDGNLFLFEIGSYFDDNGNVQDSKTALQPRMLIVNPENSSVVKVLTTGYADRYYNGTDSDNSGNHLLYLSNGNLMVSDNLARPSQLATGLTDADW